jgi:hypothetical protein
MTGYTFPVPEDPANLARYQVGRLVSVVRRDGTRFIGRVTAVDLGKPGGLMLVTCDDANETKGDSDAMA